MESIFASNSGPYASANIWIQTLVSNVRMAVLDNWRRIIWVNDKFCTLTKYERHELIGKPVSDLNLIAMAPEEVKKIHTVIANGYPWSGEIRSLTKDGDEIWVKINILSVRDTSHRFGSYMVFINDVTETKNASEKERIALDQLMRSEARYRAVVENQSDTISVCKVDGTRIFVNQRFCQFIGKTEQELLGRSILEFPVKGLPTDLLQHVDELSVDNPEVSSVFELENASGEKVWVLVRFKGIFDDEGKLFEILTIGRDVTDLKMAELNKTKHIDELERIAFMTSHDVRAPISQMQGFLELLRINAIHTDEWQTVLRMFEKSMRDLDRHTRELGAFIYQSQSSK